MAYQSLAYIGRPAVGSNEDHKSAARKIGYNIFAIVALMTAAATVSSAYHPTDGQVANPRLASMGVKNVPTSFRGAPPVTEHK